MLLRFHTIVFLCALLWVARLYGDGHTGKIPESAVQHTAIMPSKNESVTLTCQHWATKKALKIKEEIDSANKKDLKTLFGTFRESIKELNSSQKADLLVKMKEDLKKERELLQKVRDSESFNDQVIGFTSSVEKLVGPKGKKGGILQEALNHLTDKPYRKTVLYTDPAVLNPVGHDITVLKTVLLFANLAAKETLSVGELNSGADTQLLYPAKFVSKGSPSCRVVRDTLGQTCLFCGTGEFKNCLMVPTAGYVYGGDYVKGECRGIDCSSFVSRCIDAPVRYTTLDFQRIGEKIRKAETMSSEAPQGFSLVEPKVKPLQEGDIVVWRGKGSAHVVFFVKWQNEAEGKFIAIEAARQVSPVSKEGVVIDEYKLYHKNKTLTVLRPEREL